MGLISNYKLRLKQFFADVNFDNKKKLFLRVSLLVTGIGIFSILGSANGSVEEQNILPLLAKTPKIEQIAIKKIDKLQNVDAIISCPELDAVIVRRGAWLYRISMISPFKESPVEHSDLFENCDFFEIFSNGKQTFIFLEYRTQQGRPAIVYNVNEKKVLKILPRY